MRLMRLSNRGEDRFVEAKKLRKWSCEKFIEDEFESWMRNFYETQRRFSHFADPCAESGDVFCANPTLVTPSHFEFVQRFRSNSSNKKLMKASEGVVMVFMSADTFLDGEFGLNGVSETATPG